MDRDASTIPVGQTVVVADTPYIKVKLTRVTDQTGVVEYTNPTNGTTVLKMTVGVYDGSSNIEYVDQNFWTVTVNGRSILPGETAHGKIDVNAQARTINVTT